MAQSRHKQPTVGLRVEKGLQEAFATLAREKFKTTPSKLLTAIFEAAVNGKSTGQDLNIKIRLTAGATKDEVESIVRREIAAVLLAGTSKAETNNSTAETATTYRENSSKRISTEEEKSLAAEFDSLAKAVRFENSTLYIPASMTRHDNGDSMKQILTEMGLTRLWQGAQQVTTITKPNGELTRELAGTFGAKFRTAWIASRLKK